LRFSKAGDFACLRRETLVRMKLSSSGLGSLSTGPPSRNRRIENCQCSCPMLITTMQTRGMAAWYSPGGSANTTRLSSPHAPERSSPFIHVATLSGRHCAPRDGCCLLSLAHLWTLVDRLQHIAKAVDYGPGNMLVSQSRNGDLGSDAAARETVASYTSASKMIGDVLSARWKLRSACLRQKFDTASRQRLRFTREAGARHEDPS
jgi:hypothetical protein